MLVGLLRIAHAIGRGPEGERLEVVVGPRDGVVQVDLRLGQPDAAVRRRARGGPAGRTLGARIEIGAGIVGRH